MLLFKEKKIYSLVLHTFPSAVLMNQNYPSMRKNIIPPDAKFSAYHFLLSSRDKKKI